MITRDGYAIIMVTGAILLALIVSAVFSGTLWLWVAAGLAGIIFLFHFFFFRDPERDIPAGERLILSPADGKVVSVEQVEENAYLKDKSWKVSIFLSVFNVHVNRVPVTGILESLRYKKGQFLAAFNHRASELNEQSILGVRSEFGLVLFKQIAGVIARRIVYHCKEGDRVTAGERFGMIRYGSRVDVFFPLSGIVKVSVGDRVKGGISVLGEFEA